MAVKKNSSCYWINIVLLVILVVFLIIAINNWRTSSTEFVPYQKGGYINQVGGKPTHLSKMNRGIHQKGGDTLSNSGQVASDGSDGSQAGSASITQDPSLFLNPDGGQSVSQIIGSNPKDFDCRWAHPTICSMTQHDQGSLAVALKTSGCLNRKNCKLFEGSNQQGGRAKTATCRPKEQRSKNAACRPKNDWNYVTQTGSGINNNVVLLPTDPRNANQSELYNQFFRDAQNNLSEHSVENYLFPAWSSLTSSYRNQPNYCGIGQTTDQTLPRDSCFSPDEYHRVHHTNKDSPDVINTQIKNYNRRLTGQVLYTPVTVFDEIVPWNGFLNEKPANFTSERTRTFDWFAHASLGHVDRLGR